MHIQNRSVKPLIDELVRENGKLAAENAGMKLGIKHAPLMMDLERRSKGASANAELGDR
jgi:hypothetical protein